MNPEEKNVTTLSLAKRIAQARLQAKMSQQELGEAIGLSDKAISAYEHNRAIPPLEKLKQIAQTTKRSLQYFTHEMEHASTLEEKIASIEQELKEIKAMLKKLSS